MSEADYRNHIETMVEKAWANNITPILALPVPYRGFSQPIGAMRGWLTAYAQEQKIRTLDFAFVLLYSRGNYLPGRAAKYIDTGRIGRYDPLSSMREDEYTVYARYLLAANRPDDALILLGRLPNFANHWKTSSASKSRFCALKPPAAI
ncbi:hypothetical protein CEB3_c31340 [Peptococcaceae bacterium CEB3]|nr:hypothetical protein CEB3_c31340 [Peptococcaceae bacterium CEB3]